MAEATMSDSGEIDRPRRGRGQRCPGPAIKIINVSGTQVCDTWAFNAEDLREFMSMEHMRPTIGTIFPRQGHHHHQPAPPDPALSRRIPRPASMTR
jgi:uncharacterized protein YcgI (DUF1989 family)